MTKIKICGLSRQEDIVAVNRWLPDYIGFVFAESRRRVKPAPACILKDGLDSRIKAVGVFVNEPLQYITKLCQAGIIDIVQLHGDETQEYILALKQKIACPVIKAVQVQSSEQILAAQDMPCDMLLLDTFEKGKFGGSGKTFDHSLIPTLQKPYFLAGGLQNSNIVQAVSACHPFAVDVSSGVETDGVKDESKIKQIIETIRNMRQGG